MQHYIDGFAFPVPRAKLQEYKLVAEQVAAIWKEYGALAYHEYAGEDLDLEGTRSFVDLLDAKEDEAIVFGWVVFESKAARELANKQVPADPRMHDLIAPLTNPAGMIFDVNRMVYGGFEALVQSDVNTSG